MEEVSGDNINSKKRSAATAATTATTSTPKRSRCGSSAHEEKATTAREILQVPLSFIFRKSCNNNTRQQPLLSRSEADCFLRVRRLAHQLDCIVDTLRTQETSSSSSTAAMHHQHPYLRPAAAILLGANDQQQQQSHTIVHDCIAQLQTAEITTLQQWAEQNWTMAATLRDVVPAVAMEKQHVSDVQDEVCRRIGLLVDSTTTTAAAAATTLPEPGLETLIRMEDYCNRLFSKEQSSSSSIEKDPKTDASSNMASPTPVLVSKSAEDEDVPCSKDSSRQDDGDTEMEDMEKPPAIHQPCSSSHDTIEEEEEASTMVLTDLLRHTPAREKENDEPSSSQGGEESSKEETADLTAAAPFRSQGAAEVLYGFATTGTS